MQALLLLFVFVALAFGLFEDYPNEAPAFNLELSQHVNKQKTTWVAAERPAAIFANRTHGEAKLLMGTRMGGPKLPRLTYDQVNAPESFDARENWPNCATMKAIRDQSNCGSCWAFGAVEAMSDRLCSYFGSSDPKFQNISLSARDMTACCSSCGNGCQGGYPSSAWSYWKSHGLPLESCEKYPLPPCEHHMPPNHYPACSSSIAPTPSCPKRCDDGTPIGTRYFGASSYSVTGVSDMQAELQKNGPFEVAFNVYQDFESYKSGVYKHVSGPMLGGHAVKVVGWGVDNGTPYWLIANSWNSDWGEQGFFRILRGKDECGIESEGAAGAAKQP